MGPPAATSSCPTTTSSSRSTPRTSGSRKRNGMTITRTRASKDVGVKDLSLTAAKEAIEASGIELETLDAIIVSTISFPYPTPSLATLLAGELGRPDVIAYDISAACAGFAYGIGQADALVRTGAARHVLVDIGAEKLSDFVDPTDRSISFLLGDGAGAAIVGPSDEPKIGPTVWGSGRRELGHHPDDQLARELPRRRRPLAHARAGWSHRLPLGRLAHREEDPRDARAVGPDGGGHRRVRSPPGQHAHRRRARRSSSNCPRAW